MTAPAALARRREVPRNAGVKSVYHDAVRRVTAELPKITSAHVQKWLADVSPKRGPRWPMLPDSVIVAVANACNHERHELELRGHIAPEMDEYRGRAQTLRTAVDTVLSELPAFIRMVSEWPAGVPQPPQLDELLITLSDAQAANQRLRELLNPTRPSGGQRRVHNEFAFKIAAHIRFSLEQKGVKASLKPERPLIRFVASAVSAVFGDVITADALAEAIKRDFQDLKKRGSPSARKVKRGGHSV